MRILILAAIGLAACASSEDTAQTDPAPLQDDPRVGAATNQICFANNISGFSDWDGGDGVIMTRGVSDEYLVTVNRSCNTIDRAQRVGLNDNFAGGGCLRRGDRIIVSSRVFSGPSNSPFDVDRCLVTGIYEWDADAATDDESTDDETDTDTQEG